MLGSHTPLQCTASAGSLWLLVTNMADLHDRIGRVQLAKACLGLSDFLFRRRSIYLEQIVLSPAVDYQPYLAFGRSYWHGAILRQQPGLPMASVSFLTEHPLLAIGVLHSDSQLVLALGTRPCQDGP